MTLAPAKPALTTSRIAMLSIVVAFVVLSLKFAAYSVTGSVALYSDALESIVNVVTAVVALIAVTISQRPADRSHPFGHHKAEYLSTVFESVLIILAAVMILREAYTAFLAPHVLTDPGRGLAINSLAAVLNGVWSWFLIREGTRRSSPALVADGWHLATDVATSIGVLAGLILALITGWTLLDPLMAAAVALNVLWAGYKLASMSVDGLMDRSANPEIQARIREVIVNAGGGALQAHDIRTRQAGRATFIEFHLVVPGTMTVEDSHAICDRIETAIEADIDGADVSIHVEPDEKIKPGSKSAVNLSTL
jgi:cation diffusion facilitator family transporter